jgi:hypothetical protein
MAEKEPQAAVAAVVKSLACEWQYLQRVVPETGDNFKQLDEVIYENFLPAVWGATQITELETELFTLPVRKGGMGIHRPSQAGMTTHATSRQATGQIVEAMQGRTEWCSATHQACMKKARKEHRAEREEEYERRLQDVQQQLTPPQQRALQRSVDYKTGAFLTVLPLQQHSFDLSADEYRDALAVRYMKEPHKMKENCDGCQEKNSRDHALRCKKGGLITRRHNEVCRAAGEIIGLLHRGVEYEPVIREADVQTGEKALVADIKIRGLWRRQRDALLDIRVTDTDAPSYLKRPVCKILEAEETQKNTKYHKAAEERKTDFAPIVISTDGAWAAQSKEVFKRVASGLAQKWEKTYGEVISWVRVRMQFAVIRATSMCIRGARTRVRCLGTEDGEDISMMMS